MVPKLLSLCQVWTTLECRIRLPVLLRAFLVLTNTYSLCALWQNRAVTQQQISGRKPQPHAHTLYLCNRCHGI